jgi:hypothetical protein
LIGSIVGGARQLPEIFVSPVEGGAEPIIIEDVSGSMAQETGSAVSYQRLNDMKERMLALKEHL